MPYDRQRRKTILLLIHHNGHKLYINLNNSQLDVKKIKAITVTVRGGRLLTEK
jgi:prolyl-tRNA editing enzyme YbaK/EbsC (Cys-tRNA(Pro) deacylase)